MAYLKCVMNQWFLILFILGAAGCTVKAVGDPNRPITINAHITVDVKGLQNTATSIEDYVSGATDKKEFVK
ncbi:MAG: hypothetical protein KC713_05760 [Candidatus Omnitrophica bacterium]|nr:hypothetical protein [Candidatus Omnitrophota bacterium]